MMYVCANLVDTLICSGSSNCLSQLILLLCLCLCSVHMRVHLVQNCEIAMHMSPICLACIKAIVTSILDVVAKVYNTN